jgi:hypothetical protein
MIRELTRPQDRCGLGQCPAVFQEDNDLLIIGKRLPFSPGEGGNGPQDTTQVLIDRGLVTRALAGPISRVLLWLGL